MLTADFARLEAIRVVAELFAGSRPREIHDVLAAADRVEAWLRARPARLVVRPSPLTFTEGIPGPGAPTRITTLPGGRMSVVMTDAQQVTYTVEAEDSKGFEVADTLTWSEDSGGAVVTVTPAEDGMSAVVAAVAPGTATVSVTDGTLSGSDLVTITTGSVASIVLTAGTPGDEPAPAPPAA